MNGAELRQWRLDRKMRQADLGTILGMDQPKVSELERSEGPIPDDLAAKVLDQGGPPPRAVEPSAGDGGEVSGGGAEPGVAPASDGDVPPRPPRRPRAREVVVVPTEERLNELEVRLLKLIQGEDVAIPVADPGETEIRHYSQHIPGLADIVGAVNQFDGDVIRANAVAMSKAWVKLAREKPRVRAFLETLTAGGAWRDVFAATAPVILAILLNHGLLPSLPGLGFGPGAEGGYDGANGDGGPAGADFAHATAEGSLG
jgi:hypothetical protein